MTFSNAAPTARDADDAEIASLIERLATSTVHESPDLRRRLVEACLPIADGLAHRLRGRGVEDDDLEQVARAGLVAAVARYDPTLGRTLIPYLVLSVEGELKRYFRDHTWAVRPPRRLQELRLEVRSAEEALRHRLLRDPSLDELAVTLGADVVDVRTACRSSCGHHAASIDAPSATGRALVDHVVVVDDPAERIVLREALMQAVKELSERDRLLIHLRFVEELPQREIGAALGLSQMQVSRLLSATIERLRADLQPAAAA